MKRQPNNSNGQFPGTLTVLTATFALGATLVSTTGADMYIPAVAPGGIQVNPAITSRTTNGSNVVVGFEGLQAPYMIQTSSNMADWVNAGMTTVKHPNFSGTGVITNTPANQGFVRLMMLGSEKWAGQFNPGALAISNVFVGVQNCGGCHPNQVQEWAGTHHATALSRLMDANGNFTGHANDSCVVCHSVGKGQPGGFVNLATTPHLASVQCENCHGSANAHINISGSKYHPVASIAAETCGGCHDGEHHPTYEEWNEGPHRHMDTHVAEYFLSSTGESRQVSCGRCHSAATRMAMLKNYDDMKLGITNFLALPSAKDATNATATCVVCHDPHSTNSWSAQLRYPLSSTNFYTLGTTANSTNIMGINQYGLPATNTYYFGSSFANEYNPNVQVCGQCHNTRGAKWTDTSRPPHHSAQYNMLIGTVQEGYLTNNLVSRHGRLPEACVTCHVVNYAPGFTNGTIHVVEGGVTNVVPNITTNYNTGHSFEVNYHGCAIAGCHVSNGAEGIKEETELEQALRKATAAAVVAKLNNWAVTVAPTITNAFATYGQYAWEYTAPGQISNPDGLTSIVGPSAALQARIPNGIKQARFNLYMFEHDGSYGIHNRQLTPLLLRDAEAKVDAATYPAANFSAATVSGYAPLSVTFSNLGSGITTYSWNFGDGNTSSSANPVNLYTNPGVYTVTFTANGTETMTRTAYITVVQRPTVSFTGAPRAITAGQSVTFTNTSSNIGDVTSWRWQFNSADSNTRVTTTGTEPQTWTYNTPGTFGVVLRATTAAGNITTTSNAFITVTAPVP